MVQVPKSIGEDESGAGLRYDMQREHATMSESVHNLPLSKNEEDLRD